MSWFSPRPNGLEADKQSAGAPGIAIARQRGLAAGLGVLVLIASFVSITPTQPSDGGTGNVFAAGSGPRIAISALSSDASAFSVHTDSLSTDSLLAGSQLLDLSSSFGKGPTIDTELQRAVSATEGGPTTASIEGPGSGPGSVPMRIVDGQDPSQADLGGPFLADGTLLKPVAVDTTVFDATAILKRYRIRSGDTLASIGRKYKVTATTLWNSNYQLASPAALRVGSTLYVPPVNGAVHIVSDGETIKAISSRTGVAIKKIMTVNQLKDETIFIGQTLVIPGARGRPVPKPPVVRPVTSSSSSSTNQGSSVTSAPTPRPPVTYSGGRMVWPVPGGFISQYFHYGHWALDIAGTYGIPVVAAAPGVVTFAGWKNNGGGYQVWMSHGNGLYTTYNHMSAVSVGIGQYVGAGQQVGRLGMTGDATGPHCHFEVWIGAIWDGGTRVNPLNYL